MAETLVPAEWQPRAAFGIVEPGRFTMARKRWSDLTDRQKAGVVVLTAVQVSLSAAAWVDLARRPRELVRGPKPAWAAAIAVNFVGPVAYFTLGRRAALPSAASPAP
jgi:hypothetical protein